MCFNQIRLSIQVLYIFLVKTITALSTIKKQFGYQTYKYLLIDLCGPQQSESRVSKMSVSIREVNLKYQSKAWQEATCHSLQLDGSPHHQAFNQSCGRLAVFVVSSWDMKEVVSGDLSAVVTSVALIEFCRFVQWRWMQSATRLICRECAPRWH